ncbi:MAG: sodium:calcium symporter [Opitutales bacterium]
MVARKGKESWDSRIGVILAVAGSAVGLGNFLRFPGQAAEFGGGAFMLAYFISFLVIGLPICWAEWAMGRNGGSKGFNSCPAIFAAVTRIPGMKWVGVIGVVIPVIIYMYYVYIEAWCLGYAVNFAMGTMAFDSVDESVGWWARFIGAGADGSAIGFNLEQVGLYLLVAFGLNFFLIYRGIAKGIEFFCKYAMPALVILAIVVLVRVLTLGAPVASSPENNISNGLGFMWNPDKQFLVVPYGEAAKPDEKRLERAFELVGKRPLADPKNYALNVVASDMEKARGDLEEARIELRTADDEAAREAIEASISDLEVSIETLIAQAVAIPKLDETAVIKRTIWEQLSNGELWLKAAGQIFFSLSVGFGVIITYSSYLSRNDDVVLSGLAATSANEFCEVGLGGLITVPAAYAFIGAAGLAGIGLGTFDLGFKILPMVFAQMPGGAVFGFMFFFLLFLAAVTSSLSMLQPGIAFIEESLGTGRKGSVAVLGMITLMGAGFVLYFSQDVKALDTMDFWVGTLLIYVQATIQIILFGWVWGIDRGWEEAHQGSSIRIPGFFKFLMKYATPAFLIAVFVSFLLGSVLAVFGGDPVYYVTDLTGTKTTPPNLVAWLSLGLITAFAAICLVLIGSSARFKSLSSMPTTKRG